MTKCKKRIAIWYLLLFVTIIMLGCQTKENNSSNVKEIDTPKEKTDQDVEEKNRYQMKLEPETGSLDIIYHGETITASLPNQKREIQDYKEEGNEISFTYPADNIHITFKQEPDHLNVTIESKIEEENTFLWPLIQGNAYQIPLGEGKYFQSDDDVFMDYLKDQEFHVIESLSMPFLSSEQGNLALVYIMEQPYHNYLHFDAADGIKINVLNDYTTLDKERIYSYKIYPVKNSTVEIAKTYKNYVVGNNNFKTLAEKAKENPNIEKLYGAPHFYLWNEKLLSDEDVNWPNFRQSLDQEVMSYIMEKFAKLDGGEEIISTIAQLKDQDYVDNYQKELIIKSLSQLIMQKDFYDESIFTKKNDKLEDLLNKGMDSLTNSQQYELNKYALYANLENVFQNPDDWAASLTTDLILNMRESIKSALVCLDNYENVFANSDMGRTAIDSGYLFAAYDSYHSIHEAFKAQWHTAEFYDEQLYEEGTIKNKQGEFEAGFNGVGRKLNPVASFPYVEERMENIMEDTGLFNSWFIDCDATGEIYEDYKNKTTFLDDINGRLKRMSYIRDEYDLVIGSEGGHDFAAKDIAFAHGIELQTFSWMDEDMKDASSEYYIGRYYSKSGGVPDHFGQSIPVKEKYLDLFLNPYYDVPLYKLVYNDSVVTTYHWDWSTLKIKDQEKNRMMREYLYNVPPLYHIDSTEWEDNKHIITSHVNQWSDFSKDVISLEMTDYQRLSDDQFVQMTEYGDKLQVIANFSENNFIYQGNEIKAHEVGILDENNKFHLYTF